VDGGIYLLFWNVRLCPVEDSPLIGAGGNTVPATNTPVVIHHDDPVGFFPGGVDGTNLHTRRVLTLLALNRQIDEPLLGDLRRIVIMLGVFKIDKIPSLESENPDPLELRFIAGIIVFFYARIDASSATDAPGKVKTVAPQGIGDSSLCADFKFLSVFLRISLFQLSNDALLFIRGQFAKMLLEKILSFLLAAGGEEGKRKTS
jgi:hypothetical protein